MARLTGPRQAQRRGAKPKQLVVLLHGYGADGNDLIGLAPYLQRVLPDAAFVAPNGPEPCGMSPMGRQWFAIDIDDPSRMSRDPHAAVRRFAGMGERADRVLPLVNAFLDEELARAGLTDADLALVGFSQGTMLSLHTGLRRPAPPAGIVGFSGALLGGETIHQHVRHPVPVTLIHGDTDDLVPPLAMYDAAGALGRAGLPVQFHVSPGTGHSIAMDGIELAGRFLVDVFAGRWAVRPPVASAL
ncbi:MAG: prolyl oligopeptidase family serine peptidase [Pseudomonadota bacterium]|nr:prolyl oligopeptidase family serine peptidase [Pseudomonadota bacterium]